MAKRLTLGHQERLKSRKQIERLFKESKAFNLPPFRVFSLPLQPGETPAGVSLQFGIGVGTRSFKKAVERNRVKRLTREAWRLQKNDLQEMLSEQNKAIAVFLVYTGRELPGYSEVYDKVGAVLKKLMQRIN